MRGKKKQSDKLAMEELSDGLESTDEQARMLEKKGPKIGTSLGDLLKNISVEKS